MKVGFTIITFLVCFSVFAGNTGKLTFLIDGFGNVDCEVELSFDRKGGTLSMPVNVLLPFRINNELQVRIQDDIVYTYKVISKKYTLLVILLPHQTEDLIFGIQTINNFLPTIEGKSKIEVDFNYMDIPRSLDDVLGLETSFHEFDISWRAPRKLLDEEISIFPAGLIKRDSANAFNIRFTDLPESNRAAWFVYPNFKGSNEQNIQFYLLLLIGILTGVAQLNPIIERKSKTIRYQAVIALIVICVLATLFLLVPKGSLAVVKSISAPVIPHIIYILGGLLYLKITDKFLYKISGIIRDEFNEPLKYADIELYKTTDDFNSRKVKPFKRLYELENGRFEFSFIDRYNRAHVLAVSKKNRESKILRIPHDREKSHELQEVIVLEKLPPTSDTRNELTEI